MEDIDDDGPALEFLLGDIRSRRHAHVGGDDGLGVFETQGSASFCHGSLGDEVLLFQHLWVALADDAERSETLSERVAHGSRSVATEHFVEHLGGWNGSSCSGHSDVGSDEALADLAFQDGVLFGLGCLGEDSVDGRESCVVSNVTQAVYLGCQCVSGLVSERLVLGVAVVGDALVGRSLDLVIEASNTSVECNSGKLGTSNTHAVHDGVLDTLSVGVETQVVDRVNAGDRLDCHRR